MIKNYFKTAWRNLVNRKFYSLLNIVGLTIGLAVGMLILIWVKDELSYNKFHTKADQIYQVNASIGSGSTRQVWGTTPGPVAAFALKEVPGVVSAVRVITAYDYSVFSYKDKVFKEDYGTLSFVDDAFFKLFDFKLLKGNINKPFPTDQSVIITESTAKRFFGDDNPMGKTITGDSRTPFVVTGVLADFPGNSSITGEIFFPISLRKQQYSAKGYWKSMDGDWGNYYCTTFLQVRPDASVKIIGNKLTQIHKAHHAGIKPTDGVFSLQPLADIHLYNPDGSGTVIKTVKIFSIVAMLILLIACINYVNLSTALSILRSKEVSIRKVIGADRTQLFFQFIIETVLCFVIALLLAFAVIYASMPIYNNIAGKHMHFDLFSAGVWQVILSIIIATLIASSIYPALLLSSFKPINALKGKVSGAGNGSFRKVLVVCQFAFSIGLIIGTLIINKQLQYINQMEVGYNRQHVFSIQMHGMRDHFDAVKAELKEQSSISGVTSGDGIVNSGNSTTDTDWDGKDSNDSFVIHPFYIDKDFLSVLQIKLASGNNFTGSKSDTSRFILNETAVRLTGIKNPIGKRFKFHSTNGIIIGVAKDFHFASAKWAIEPAIFSYSEKGWQLYIKTTGKDAPAAVASVQKLWKQYNAQFPFEYNFLDDEYNSLYKSEQQTAHLFNIFAGIAIFISCLGLFGLATYTSQVKVKEIGIRKVLGASVANITSMLSKDFLVLVIIAFVIASPIAWYMMSKWMMGYAYRAPLHWWIIAIAGLSAIVIAFATICFQSIKAALANPVKSLRSE